MFQLLCKCVEQLRDYTFNYQYLDSINFERQKLQINWIQLCFSTKIGFMDLIHTKMLANTTSVEKIFLHKHRRWFHDTSSTLQGTSKMLQALKRFFFTSIGDDFMTHHQLCKVLAKCYKLAIWLAISVFIVHVTSKCLRYQVC